MPGRVLRSVAAVANFEGTPRDAIHALKYEGRHAISSAMGRLMGAAAAPLRADAVAPVSLHALRRRERGYDQAALLARAVGRELSIDVDVHLLKRTRRTRQQVGLGAADRRDNVKDAFSCERQLNAESVLLVDDVFTTGATLEAAARAVRQSGAGTVYGVVFGYAKIGSDVSRHEKQPAKR